MNAGNGGGVKEYYSSYLFLDIICFVQDNPRHYELGLSLLDAELDEHPERNNRPRNNRLDTDISVANSDPDVSV